MPQEKFTCETDFSSQMFSRRKCNRGSLAVSRERTEKSGQGMWYNFKTNESGDMMDLVRDTKQFKRDKDLQLFVMNEILPHLKYLPPESESGQLHCTERHEII